MFSVEATISATVSDNEPPATMTTLPNSPSDDGEQYRASSEARLATTTAPQGMKEKSFCEAPEEGKTHLKETQEEKENRSTPFPFLRMPKLKREKSYTETLERKKKRVKFSPNDDDDGLVVDTRVFEAHAVSAHDGDADDGALSHKIKKLLKKRSKRKKSSIETQTDGNDDGQNRDTTKATFLKDKQEISSSRDCDRTREPFPSFPEGQNKFEVDAKHHVDARDVSSPDCDATEPSATAASGGSPSAEPLPAAADSANHDVSVEAAVPTMPIPSTQENENDLSSHVENENNTGFLVKEHDLLLIDNEETAPANAGSSAKTNECEIYIVEGPVLEGQELEICLDRGEDEFHARQLSKENINLISSAEEESNPTSCQATVKREGTFTLDGPPPAKITKSSCDAVEDASRKESSLLDDSREPVIFFVDLDSCEVKKTEETQAMKARAERGPSSRSKSRSPQKPAKNDVRKKDASEKPQEQSSTVTSLKNTAKRTFVSAWRTAMKAQDSSEKGPKLTRSRDAANSKASPVSEEERNTKVLRKKSDPKVPKSVTWDKKVTSREPQESSRPSRDPLRSLHLQPLRPLPERSSMWSGVCLSSMRREGTFTKKYDSEKDRLQAECNRLNVDKERLQSELSEARTRLEEEITARKALRRTHELNLRQLREGELRRTEVLLADLRNRLEDEKREALDQQKGALTRIHESDLIRVERERDEDHRRLQQENKAAQEKLRADMRREVTRVEPPQVQCCHSTDRDLDRLNRDLSTLREHKKRLEDAVMLDEVRSKDRSIGQLERQLSAQSAKIRLQEEKAREVSNDRTEDAARKRTTRGGGSGVSSKRHKEAATTKDGRTREKESCVSASGPVNNNSVKSNLNASRGSPDVGADDTCQRTRAAQEEGATPEMAAQVEELSQEVEQQRELIEQQRQQIELQLQQLEETAKELEQQKQKWDEEKQAMKQEMEEQKTTVEAEREELQHQIEDKIHQVEEQKLVMEAQKQVMEDQKQVMEEQKQVIEEQQLRIADLAEESMERECLPPVPPPPAWHPRRESCVKVCELPTVLEQSSDDEVSPTTSQTLQQSYTHDLYSEYEMPAPSTFLTPTSPTTEPPIWPQSVGDLLCSQYEQLSKEHQELQKSYQLLVSTSSASSPAVDLNGKEGPSEWWSAARVMELEAQVSTLKAELQESRDHADLLEFRILEFTEEDRASDSGSSPQTCDQSTATDLDDVSIPATNEDLSLPLSIDSGLDLSSDYKKARVTEGRAWLAQLSRATGEAEAAALHHLAALLDWVAALPAHAHHALSSPMSPTLAAPTPTPKAKMGVEELGGDLGRDLMLLAARLQETLTEPAAQEAVLLDTIAKLRVLDSSLSELQSRVVTLTEENRELQEAVTSLSEAHETRTEASGTESELVHRKTPSIHSDLSDSESDAPEHAQHGSVKLVTSLDASTSLDATTSFQESGIFDTSCELVHVTTQTDLSQGGPLPPSGHELKMKSECDLQQAESDLQSAVARLAAIRSAVQGRDLRHLRLQDLQESDEYLKAALDEERVILSKAEYDSFVEGERRLQHELEHLKCEKEHLSVECESLKNQITSLKTGVRGSDAEEAMKGEIRVLKQRLASSERARLAVFEEKCELEEEENDSRLMVQRLESQMEAAREMENLLSASLAQEQEISRELHRRVRDLQILEKDYRGRLDKLEAVTRRTEEKASALAQARDALSQQLSFAAWGLVAAEYWRQLVPEPSAALVPYGGYPLKVSPATYPTKPFLEGRIFKRERAPREADNDVYVCPPVVCDVCVQTCPNVIADVGVQTQMAKHSAEVQHGGDPAQPAGGSEEELYESARKRARHLETRTQATMTVDNTGPTEREQFYLEQIESLQREKINLRKGHDNERRDSLQQHSDLEEEMEAVRQQLEEAERDKCHLLFRLEEAQDERDEVKKNLLVRIEELKGDMSRYNDLYELEKKALRREYEARLAEQEKERGRQDERMRQLEHQLSTFRQELEIVGVSIAGDLVEYDNGCESVLGSGRRSSARAGDSDGELVEKIRELVKSETALRQRICDLEKKECAYRETIREADKIMSSHVTSYKQRIEELEASMEQQSSKIQQLEASEERLRANLRNNSRSSDGARISDLLDRLIETENSELKLKERVWGLERSEKELQIKLMEGEKVNQSLRAELRDQEELVHRLMTLETENNALSAEINQAKDSARKMSEVQQNESYLRGRVEELEMTENMLRETLQQADLILAQREKKLRDQVSSLQEEVQSYKAQLESAASKEHGARECEVSYKKQLEELKARLAETERQLRESSSETNSQETQHRSEVTKLRNQLKLGNSQLNELERLNCELRDRVLAAEAQSEQLAKELEEQCRRHEQDLLTLNLQVSAGESHVKELQGQLEQLSHEHAASELDVLAASPIAPLYATITSLITALKSCESCSETQKSTLAEVTAQLGTLAELLEGRASNSDTDVTLDSDEGETFITDTAENLAGEATTTPPPTPAGEGLREHSSGDATNCDSGASFLRTKRRRSRRRLEERSSRRLVRPQGSSTILEELEEKVRELEEAIGRKEEELRLADNEASELNQQLQSRDAALTLKGEEVEHLNSTLASLRQQLMQTVEDYERARMSLEAKHKVDLEELTQRMEQLTKQAESLAARGTLKDSIISTLASQIRAILRSGNMSVVINQLRRLGEGDPCGESPAEGTQGHPSATSPMPTVPDFDVDAVCSFLSQPSEMAYLSQSAISNGTEPSSHVTLQSDVSLALSATELSGRVTCHGSSSLAQRRKSRIPRYMPSSVPSAKPASKPVRMVKPDVVPEQSVKPEAEPVQFAKPAPSPAPASRPVSVHTRIAEPTPEPRREFKQTPAKPTPMLKPLATSTPAKPTGRKDSTRRERPGRFLSDARKVKRMVTGVAPLDAAVDCSSAPEWRERSPISTPSDVEATCVPRPQNLHITRRVGVDGVVIAWAPLDHDCVAGFQVLVGGRVVQHVRSPHRTKALVTGLPLAGAFTIGLVTVAHDGRCSTPVIVTQDRSRVYPGRSAPSRPTLQRCVPTCL
ncbi:protein lava lamp-like isoform X5 [Penaeus indicus]|uniref:protein lava lamp-like isoform X5 n=1 Tax=Penaeus indicus TaxID=29960 RepID=UPI00300D3B38